MFALVCCLSLPILVEQILKASFTLSHIYQLSCVLEMVDMAFKRDCKRIIDIVVYITHNICPPFYISVTMSEI